MKVCLATRHATAHFSPLALLYLKAYLVERSGFAAGDIPILEFAPTVDGKAMAASVLAEQPDVVGFSCYVWNITATLEAARLVKEARPEARIVLGGPEVGPVADAVLARNPAIDVIVRSDGEVPLADLVCCWRDGRDIEAVNGVTWRDAERIVSQPEASFIRDLNEIPSPHQLGYVDHTDRTICIETQRGCVYTCSFCFFHRDYSIPNRRFDLTRVKEELRFWLSQDIKMVYFMDPIFNLNLPRAKEIIRFIAEHNDRAIPCHAELWAEFVDDELAGLFREAHFDYLEVGLQTTNAESLDLVQRKLKMQKFLDGIGHLKRHECYFEVHLIAGLPGDTLATLKESLNFAAGLYPPALTAFRLQILPGTELWRKADEMGIVFDPDPPYVVRSHPTMDAQQIARANDVAKTATLLWGWRALRLIARDPSIRYSGLVDDWLEWHPGPPTQGQVTRRLVEFIEHCTRKHGLSPDLFLTSARMELEAQARRAVLPAHPVHVHQPTVHP